MKIIMILMVVGVVGWFMHNRNKPNKSSNTGGGGADTGTSDKVEGKNFI